MVKVAFRCAAQTINGPAQLLNAIDLELVDLIPPGAFMTAVATLFSAESKGVALSSVEPR